MSEYRFPTQKEASELIEEASKIFTALGMGSKPMPVIPEEFAKMLFTLNPDAFGNRLENAERWLRECIGRVTKESEDQAKEEMRRFLADFPMTTDHGRNLKTTDRGIGEN